MAFLGCFTHSNLINKYVLVKGLMVNFARKLVSVEESKGLVIDMVLIGLDVVHYTLVGGKNDVSKLSGWEEFVNEIRGSW